MNTPADFPTTNMMGGAQGISFDNRLGPQQKEVDENKLVKVGDSNIAQLKA